MAEQDWWANEDGDCVSVGIAAPAFGKDGLDVEIRVVPSLQDAWRAAKNSVVRAKSPTWATIEEAMQREGSVEVSIETMQAIIAERVVISGEEPDGSSLVHPAQREALTWLRENADALHAEITRVAAERAQNELEERLEWDERVRARDMADRRSLRRTNVPHGLDEEPDPFGHRELDPWDDNEDDDYAASLFDSHEGRRRPPSRPKAEPVTFSIHTAIIEEPDSDDRCEIGLRGNWSLDEEHGLGVRVYDGEVIEMGEQSITF
ncbi:MAG: hypothetical protein KDA24_20965 [Deltaproteobacteria bacterium]|nr:hypothetical protein [Deltaproteobacteria bacterium]